jgi:hypothetical protein
MLIQIVPQLSPSPNGVGDYGLALARQLHKDYGLTTCFIVGDPDWDGPTALEGFLIKKVVSRSADALNSVLTDTISDVDSLLLHYVGYGYAKRGCPIWLVEGLRLYQKRTFGSVLLITMFHEIYATGYPVWTSAFWTSPLQKHLAAQVIRLSDRLLTSKPAYAEMLRMLCPKKQLEIPILPVFSSIGEPEHILPLAKRKPRIIVFGSNRNRSKVYNESLSALSFVCQQLNIQEIIDIGSPMSLPISKIEGVPIVQVGIQPAEKVSTMLQDSWVGFFHYPLDCLSRSTIFAAYCAHGVMPVGVNCYDCEPEQDGLSVNYHYWLADSQGDGQVVIPSLIEAQTIAEAASNWYQEHNLSKQAEQFFHIMFNR